MGSSVHKVVIVEDEGLIAADLQGRLERAGYRVPAVAGSAGEALEVIREKSPDLILMDIRLRGNVDGIQVAEQVRRDFDIPVVYLTAYEDHQTLQRASQTQAFGYIKKPIDSASLQGSIEMAISKHRHERLLREQRDWFSASFAAVPDVVLVADLAGRISYINPAAEGLFGYKVDDVLGRPLYDLLRIAYQNGDAVDDLMPLAMLQGTPVALPGNIWLEGGRGRRYGIEGSLAPRWREGRADGVVVTFKDVTLRWFEEEQSRQDQKHSALSRLADGIAGHLDLELSVVAEESTRLLNSLPSSSTLRSAAKTIESAALDACGVTCRLRAFGQEREIKPLVVQVNEILKKLEKTWHSTLPGLSVHPDPAPRPVHADPAELTRTLEMLLRHAHHWSAAGGSIALSASKAELEGLHEWVRVRISYTTTNEDAASVERVFDPSWDGNWEGLPFAYGITKRMGGLLSARMEREKKVAFEIHLPSVDVTEAAAPIEGENEKTLLVIERNSEVRRLLHGYFEEHGFSVLEAGDCEDALLLAESSEWPIRLVIANPAPDDRLRSELPARLVDLKPGVCVRIIQGYREECGSSDGQTAWHYLTKWDLLEWANGALGPAPRLAGAN
ncbi:MAG TPA: response regulator [Bryobacteraceae bacterium]|jgi:PAS domain S-box-containing protein|nr:response regulator [Bryobacteraceae bacterium]